MTKLDHTYRPNWSDKRVKKRVEAVITWAETRLTTRMDTYIGSPELDKVFGPKGNELGDYLRGKLLVRTGSYEIGKRPYMYRRRKGAVGEILSMYSKTSESSSLASKQQQHHTLNVNTSFFRLDIHRQKHAEELAKLKFNMNLKSNRYWHPLLNLSRAIKPEFWAPYLPYNYDIEACAPTILLQLAEKANLNHLVGQPIHDYLKNKREFRQHIADLAGIDYDRAKRLVNSFFNGARLARNKYCDAWKMLSEVHLSPGQISRHIYALQQDKQVRRLRQAISALWLKIKRNLKMSFRTSKDKWHLYFYLERKILDVMVAELIDQECHYFTEHDGFRTNKPVDINKVEERVKKETGFLIKLEAS